LPAELIARELEAYVEQVGLTGVSVQPIAASIEDAFMWYMGEQPAA
jgi:hypothetical protein